MRSWVFWECWAGRGVRPVTVPPPGWNGDPADLFGFHPQLHVIVGDAEGERPDIRMPVLIGNLAAHPAVPTDQEEIGARSEGPDSRTGETGSRQSLGDQSAGTTRPVVSYVFRLIPVAAAAASLLHRDTVGRFPVLTWVGRCQGTAARSITDRFHPNSAISSTPRATASDRDRNNRCQVTSVLTFPSARRYFFTTV